MGRFAKENGGGEFEQCPAGTHVAVCTGLIDLGTRHEEYQGKPVSRNQVVIRWETPDELMEDGQPFIVSSFYTNSLSEKSKMKPMLEAWRGKQFTEEELAGFDLQNILGAPCMLNVTHNDKGKARVSAVMALPKGTPKPKPAGKCVAFWIEEWDQAAFDELPEGFRKFIMQSDEYKARTGEPVSALSALDDDVPF